MKKSTYKNNPDKAYKNNEFLNSPAARDIRVQCELTEPQERFKNEKIKDTVVMFGSARICSETEAKSKLQKLEESLKQSTELSKEDKCALATAKSRVKTAHYYEDCQEIAKQLTQFSRTLSTEKQFTICTGGGPGIMEAGNRGAHEANGRSIALGISLPFEQGINDYASEELSFEFHYFFVRKFWFVYMAKALIAFPGGFGTMDELFEILTLIQTGKTPKVPIILYGSDFWKSIFNVEKLVEYGTISPEDLDLFQYADKPEEALELVKEYIKKS